MCGFAQQLSRFSTFEELTVMEEVKVCLTIRIFLSGDTSRKDNIYLFIIYFTGVEQRERAEGFLVGLLQ